MISKTWNSNLSPVILPKIWSPLVKSPLINISNIVSNTLEDCKLYRKDLVPWVNCFDSLIGIANSNKRHLVRPQLVLLGYHGVKKQNNSHDITWSEDGVEEFAAGIELHHLFTFIHDDVMDNAEMRRGKPTITKNLRQLGVRPPDRVTNLAVIVGDIIQAKAMDLFAKGASKNSRNNGGGIDAWKTVLDGAQRSGASQFEDVLGWEAIEKVFSNEIKEENDISILRQYLERHLIDKTAYQGFVSPLLAGVYLGSKINFI